MFSSDLVNSIQREMGRVIYTLKAAAVEASRQDGWRQETRIWGQTEVV